MPDTKTDLLDHAQTLLATPPEGPEGVRERLDTANMLVKAGQHETALALIEAVLKEFPTHLGAHGARVDCLAKVDLPRARTAAEDAIQVLPNRTILYRKLADLLIRERRFDHAEETIRNAIEMSGGRDAGCHNDLGRILLAKGNAEGAKTAFSEAIRLHPKMIPAIRGQVAALRVQGRSSEALALVNKRLETHSDARALIEEKVEVLEELGEARRLIDFALPHIRRMQDDAPVRMVQQTASACRAEGRADEAEALFSQVLMQRPTHDGAHLGRIRTAIDCGDLKAAKRHLENAEDHLPGHEKIALEKVTLAEKTGDANTAVSILRNLLADAPDDAQIALRLGALLRDTAQGAAAAEFYKAAIESSPEHRPLRVAIFGLLRSQGKLSAALIACYNCPPVLETAVNLSEVPDHVGDADLILPEQAFDVSSASPSTQLIDRIIAKIDWHDEKLGTTSLARIAVFCQGRGRPEVTARAYAAIASRTDVTPHAAKEVLSAAYASGDSDLVSQLKSVILDRLPGPQRAEFLANLEEITDGASQALTSFRRALGSGERRLQDAVTVLSLLHRSGASRIALRYGRVCLRRWPTAAQLLLGYHEACLQAGDPEEAERLLPLLQQHVPQNALIDRTFRTLIANGTPEEAYRFALKHIDDPNFSLPLLHCILASIAVGDAETATRFADMLQARPHKNPAYAHHFRTTHPGSMLNELRLYKAYSGSTGATQDVNSATNFFYAAQAVLRGFQNQSTDRSVDKLIPRHIVQYWDAKDPPAAIERLVADWRDAPGFEHSLFNRDTAMAWISEHGERSHVRAFRAARNAAEQADFFRLVYLFHCGGIYSDADNRLVDDLLPYCTGHDLVLFSETFSGVRNDLIFARAHNPIIGYALEMCTQALITFEKEITWSKTGPGLLSRAAARAILDGSVTDGADLAIKPEAELRRLVQPALPLPYKATPKHWNDRTGRVPEVVLEALRSFGAGHEAGT